MIHIFNLFSVTLVCFVEVLKWISIILNYSLKIFNKYIHILSTPTKTILQKYHKICLWCQQLSY